MRLVVVLTACVVLLGGCASAPPNPKTARIDSYARSDADSFKIFVLVPAAGQPNQNSLVFQEMAAKIVPILQSIGMVQWSGDVQQPPDIFIDVKWTFPETKAITTSGSVPIYGETGGDYTSHNSTSVINGKLVTTTGSSYTVPTYGVIGSQNYTRTALLSSGGISLRAYEAKPFITRFNRIKEIEAFTEWAKTHAGGYSDAKNQYSAADIQSLLTKALAEKKRLEDDDSPSSEIWFIAAWSVSRTPIEARLDYPKYLKAAAGYIGKSSNGQRDVVLENEVNK